MKGLDLGWFNQQGFFKGHLIRFGLPMLMVWSITWLLGLTILAYIATGLKKDLTETELDNDLALYATALYGLTWFDDDGTFHEEIFELESRDLAAPLDLWVLGLDGPENIVKRAEQPRFQINQSIHTEALQAASSLEEHYFDGVDGRGKAYRAYAIPTFTESDSTQAIAMIVAIADPHPGWYDNRRFVRNIVITTVVLGIIGLLIGLLLTHLSIQPAVQSLAQREQFLGAAAHEFRTPIAALQGICESALNKDEEPALALQRMHGIVTQTASTVNNLLLFAQLDNGLALKKEPVRLDLLVDTLLPDSPIMQNDSGYIIDVKDDLHESVVSVDARLASVAIRNLLDNACRYCVLGTSKMDLFSQYSNNKSPLDEHDSDGSGMAQHGQAINKYLHAEVSVLVQGNKVVVSNSGSGFPLSVLEQQGKRLGIAPEFHGNGLGVAIVARIAELHGARFQLANMPEGGAQVVLEFKRS